eukprot:2621863-Amphidinium_carterae.3
MRSLRQQAVSPIQRSPWQVLPISDTRELVNDPSSSCKGVAHIVKEVLNSFVHAPVDRIAALVCPLTICNIVSAHVLHTFKIGPAVTSVV